MVRRTTLAAILLLAGTYTLHAFAQDDAPRPRRLGSLSERLDQFRRDLLGDDRPKNSEPQGSTRKVTRRPKVNNAPAAPPTAAPAATADGPVFESNNGIARDARPTRPPVPVAPSPEITPPTRLQPQAARRATGGAGLNPADVEPVDLADRIKQDRQAVRRPTIVRPGDERTPMAPSSESKSGDEADSTTEESAAQDSAPEDSHADNSASEAPETDPSDAKTDDASPDSSSDHEEHGGASRSENVARERMEDSAAPSGVLFSGQSPVISVVATGPRKVLIGKEAQFLVRIRNTGAAANNVVVSVNIPNYTELVSVQPTSGTAHSPGQGPQREPLEWKLPRLNAGGEETLELKLVPRKSNPLDLAMHWTFTPEASQTLVEVQEPKLAMAITGPDEVLFGQSKIYKLTVSNPGNGDTENVTVGLLPIGRSTEAAANHRLGTLRAGESKTIDIELTARQAGAITIKAQAFAEGGLRADAAEQVLVRRASLRVEVAAPKIKYAGTVGSYRVKVTNAGNATAENVQVAAMLPPDAKYVSSTGNGRMDPQAGKINWSIGTLQAGAERMFDMQCSLSAPGENRTQFVALGDGDLSAAATSTTHVEALADLKLEVRDPQGPIAVGEDTVYEVHVRNRGTKPAEEIDLTVFFSDGLEATSADGPPHDISNGQIVFRPVASLAAGETAVFRVHAKAEKPGNHVFRAEVVCQSPQIKLAAEEATHFYGDDRPTAFEPGRDRPARMARRGEFSPPSENADGSQSADDRGALRSE